MARVAGRSAPALARDFYAVIAVGLALGLALGLRRLQRGIHAVLVGGSERRAGAAADRHRAASDEQSARSWERDANPRWLAVLGWITVVVMTAASVAMFATWK